MSTKFSRLNVTIFCLDLSNVLLYLAAYNVTDFDEPLQAVREFENRASLR